MQVQRQRWQLVLLVKMLLFHRLPYFRLRNPLPPPQHWRVFLSPSMRAVQREAMHPNFLSSIVVHSSSSANHWLRQRLQRCHWLHYCHNQQQPQQQPQQQQQQQQQRPQQRYHHHRRQRPQGRSPLRCSLTSCQGGPLLCPLRLEARAVSA